jgi:hypothetical protein
MYQSTCTFDTSTTSMLKKQYQQYFQTLFAGKPQKVFNQKELQKLFEEQKSHLRIRSYNLTKFISLLTELAILKKVEFKFFNSETSLHKTRYLFGKPDKYDLTKGLGKNPYLSFESALHYHALLNKEPKINNVTIEQSPKKTVVKVLAQDRIDLAFSQEAKTANTMASYGKNKWLIHNGMFTGNIGLCDYKPSPSIKITDIERTILDATVRSTLVGGPERVLEFYKKAKGKVSTQNLLSHLKNINYTYPYHQSIGFYLEASGYDVKEYEGFKEIPMPYKFYLDYGMESTNYNKDWKVYYPDDLT